MRVQRFGNVDCAGREFGGLRREEQPGTSVGEILRVPDEYSRMCATEGHEVSVTNPAYHIPGDS
jgi:hypothetical protein